MNRFNTDYPQLESMIDDDISTACQEFNNKWTYDAELIGLDITQIDVEYDESTTLQVDATIRCEDLEFEIKFDVIDDIDHDEYVYPEITKNDIHDAYMHRYYMSMNQKYDAQWFKDRLAANDIDVVYSATAIMAADEDDPFADMGFDDIEDESETAPVEDDASISDNLDDMADTLDDINDALQNFKEDDIDIETENNISDHFIAECEKCHGIFITAIVESDQSIEKISGTCPLCDKDCDQYLKWVIKEL